MVFEDMVLHCRDCGNDFTFTAGEQEFYQTRGLMNVPGRCPACRAARRAQARGGAAPREMHPAVCAECGKDCLVPFLPQKNTPIYCSICFDRVRSARAQEV